MWEFQKQHCWNNTLYSCTGNGTLWEQLVIPYTKPKCASKTYSAVVYLAHSCVSDLLPPFLIYHKKNIILITLLCMHTFSYNGNFKYKVHLLLFVNLEKKKKNNFGQKTYQHIGDVTTYAEFSMHKSIHTLWPYLLRQRAMCKVQWN